MNDDGWRSVPGFPGYSINHMGQVSRDATGRLLIPRYNEYGVPYVGLTREKYRQYNRSLPRLVALAFLQRPSDVFDTPIQLDGDSTNCCVDNLMWRPRWYAIRYKRQFEQRYDNPINATIHAINEGERFPDSLSTACRYGLLEKEVVLSIINRTPAWPTYQTFEILE